MRIVYSLTDDMNVLLNRVNSDCGQVNYIAEVEFYPSFDDMLAVIRDWVKFIRSMNN